MKILAIDTSMNCVAACVFDGDEGRVLTSASIAMERGHAEALMPLIDRVVSCFQGGFSALDKVAVTVGPGSFTGIRVGVAAARAIGIALNVPVVGVSTLAAFAGPLVIAGGESTIVAAIDARHDHVYAQAFTPDGQTILRPRIARPCDFMDALATGPIRAVGPACGLMMLQAWSQLISVESASKTDTPSIEYVARLGRAADPAYSPPNPLYLKAADVSVARGETPPRTHR